ncbi:MAG: DEAD/DEAH box helicase [Planctomycetota bacterium]
MTASDGAQRPPGAFDDLGLSGPLLSAVRARGFVALRPIQAEAIPPSLEGRDVLGLARTGTGKTAAFVLPLLERLLRAGDGSGAAARPRALVLAPTRELCAQIAAVVEAFAAETELGCALVIGGVSAGPQRAALEAGADVIVATTGRLLDLARDDAVDLGGVETVVLDEADRMIDMGFLADVEDVLRRTPARSQTSMYSATMPPELLALAQGTLADPVVLDLGGGMPAETIDHALVLVRESRKPRLLRALIDAGGFAPAIVFVRTKQRAKAVFHGLEKRGERVALLHGDRGQASRERALTSFRSGDSSILVATDLASRGLDVEGVAHVVNYDVPLEPDTYVHRIGRTGRAERAGVALTFVGEGDLGAVRAIEHRIGARVDRRVVEGFAPLEDEDLAAPRRPRRRRRR